MGRVRPILSLLAVFGVLLHGAMVVRHGTAMLGWMQQVQALKSGMGVICLGNGEMSPLAAPDAPAIPASAGDPPKCPICLGMGSAVAILPIPDLDPRLLDRASARVAAVGEIIAQKLAVRPPPRAPPAIS
ncbi:MULTISPECIES: DUF2946 family protein [Rhodomicrobium]|uniref:DUF2946 family protein n=1 Tax=Rhodomicrobium TaxID=1068 RepID=UPI00148201B0|nr:MULTISPECIES: DUF2946 family protein [Rhodomicrobium]